jgi:hypothetical protein
LRATLQRALNPRRLRRNIEHYKNKIEHYNIKHYNIKHYKLEHYNNAALRNKGVGKSPIRADSGRRRAAEPAY